MESCAKHPHERGIALCGRCGDSWCANCLVYTHGQKKPPFCLECAMFAGGVRSTAARPALSRREMKARLKVVKAAADDAGGTEVQPAAALPIDLADDVPAREPGATDWSAPWWEDRQPTLAD